MGVGIHHDGPLFSAIWIRDRRTLDCRQIFPDEVLRVIGQLLLVSVLLSMPS